MYVFLDWLLLFLHSGLMAFNLLGWVWKRTRRLHLLSIGLTIASWFGLGVWYGWGYCPPTAWHWQVKRKLGETNLPSSCIKYYLDKTTGLDWNSNLIDGLTVLLGLMALVAAGFVNWNDRRKSKEESTKDG